MQFSVVPISACASVPIVYIRLAVCVSAVSFYYSPMHPGSCCDFACCKLCPHSSHLPRRSSSASPYCMPPPRPSLTRCSTRKLLTKNHTILFRPHCSIQYRHPVFLTEQPGRWIWSKWNVQWVLSPLYLDLYANHNLKFTCSTSWNTYDGALMSHTQKLLDFVIWIHGAPSLYSLIWSS